MGELLNLIEFTPKVPVCATRLVLNIDLVTSNNRNEKKAFLICVLSFFKYRYSEYMMQ